jgi:hypothetical protein
MLIDCDTCAARTIACGDCVVNFLLADRASSIELDSAEENALGALASGGLLPPLRLVPRYQPRTADRDHNQRDHNQHEHNQRDQRARPDQRVSGGEKSDDGRTATA